MPPTRSLKARDAWLLMAAALLGAAVVFGSVLLAFANEPSAAYVTHAQHIAQVRPVAAVRAGAVRAGEAAGLAPNVVPIYVPLPAALQTPQPTEMVSGGGGPLPTETPSPTPCYPCTPSPTPSPTPCATCKPSPTPPRNVRIIGYKLFVAQEGPYVGHLNGLSGWTITATLVGVEDVTATTTTDALGRYEFTPDALAGMAFPGATIRICEEDRPGWVHISPLCVSVTLPYPLPREYTLPAGVFTNAQERWGDP